MALQGFGTFGGTINIHQISRHARDIFHHICYAIKDIDWTDNSIAPVKKIKLDLSIYTDVTEDDILELLNLKFIYTEKGYKCYAQVFAHIEVDEKTLIVYVNEKVYLSDYISNVLGDNVPAGADYAINAVKGKYAVRLYELVVQHGFQSFDIEFSQFRAYMGFGSTYKSHMILEYLTKAENELKERYVFKNISHEELRREGGSKRQGKLIGLSFHVENID